MRKKVNIGQLFEETFLKLSSPTFGEGLGGELPIYIQPVPIEQYDEVEIQIPFLIKRLNEVHKSTIEINLYNLCIEMLRESDTLDIILESEKEIDHQILVETLDSILNIDDVIQKIVSQIEASNQVPSIVLFTGVGNAYPMLRSHSILNNIHGLAGDIRFVLIFPGSYNNQQLSLFDCIHDENYYRAHNLNNVTREI